MLKTTFETINVETSLLGFGCMRFPTKDGKIDREQASVMLQHALDNGVTYFDTAWMYHNHESEEFVGEFFKDKKRDTFMLATKLPTYLLEEEKDTMEYFTKQLEKLQTDYVDFYLLHAINKERFALCQKLGVMDIMIKLKKEGKIKSIGFSFHGKNEEFPAIADAFPWDFAQIQHNYIDNTVTDSFFLNETLRVRGIPAVIMEPVRGGSLAKLPDEVEAILKAQNEKRSIASWAIRWVAAEPNVKVVLSGMSTLEQVKDNIATLADKSSLLCDDARATVNKAVEKLVSYKTVPCTACAYCMDCPFGVNIPGVFTMYNEYKMFGNTERAKNAYANMTEKNTSVANCTACGKCSPLCPQMIAIPERLQEVHKELSAL